MGKTRPSDSGLAQWVRVALAVVCAYVVTHLVCAILLRRGVFIASAQWLGMDVATWCQVAEVLVIMVTAVLAADRLMRVTTPSPVWPLGGPLAGQEYPQSVLHDLSLLYEIGQGISITIDQQELLERITRMLQQHLDLRELAILLADGDGQFLRVQASFGFQNEARVNSLIFQVGEGVSGEVARTGQTIYVQDTRRDPRYLSYRGELPEPGALLAIPLRYKREILGVINFGRAGVGSFSPTDVTILTLVANQVALAIANARLYAQTRELAVRDDLTGLYNRRHFMQVLQIEWKRAVRFRRDLTVLIIDVDFFKAYNDTFGHLHGDQVLKQLAEVLRRNIREVDTIARFGGEEFIALLPDTDKLGGLHVAEKLRSLVEQERFPIPHSGEMRPLTISVGVAVYPDDAGQIEDLIDHADIALYEAKDNGRNRVVCFPAVAEAASKEPRLVRD